MFNWILPQYRKAMANLHPHPGGKFRTQAEVHYREARLLALAYPHEMETLLLPLVKDPTADKYDRLCSVGLLGVLAGIGMKSSQNALYEIASGTDKSLLSVALRELSDSDLKGEYRELYLNKSREKVWAAFDALAYWGDASAIRGMEIIAASFPGNHYPESTMRLNAETALGKLNLLNSAECERRVGKIIDGTDDEDQWFPWAVRVAQTNSYSGLADALRRRLDTEEKELFGPIASDLDQAGINAFDHFANGSADGIIDPFFDDALIAYSQTGGKLHDAERRRLYNAGYIGDPKVRLEEILSSSK